MRATSGWLAAMELAMFCRIMVLPVRGAATISPRWPLPRGVIMSSTRAMRLSCAVSSRRRSLG